MLKVTEFAIPHENMAVATYRFLEEHVLTEEHTDELINIVTALIVIRWLPFAGTITKRVLDDLLPGKLLAALQAAFIKFGWASYQDFRRQGSPFDPARPDQPEEKTT